MGVPTQRASNGIGRSGTISRSVFCRRGLVVVPGPLEKDYAGPRELVVRLMIPGGDEKVASMRLGHFFGSPPPKENRLVCILKGVTKVDVPIGTEVWAEG